jgi:hypothetical protein
MRAITYLNLFYFKLCYILIKIKLSIYYVLTKAQDFKTSIEIMLLK